MTQDMITCTLSDPVDLSITVNLYKGMEYNFLVLRVGVWKKLHTMPYTSLEKRWKYFELRPCHYIEMGENRGFYSLSLSLSLRAPNESRRETTVLLVVLC
jgi:hypothetical protein